MLIVSEHKMGASYCLNPDLSGTSDSFEEVVGSPSDILVCKLQLICQKDFFFIFHYAPWQQGDGECHWKLILHIVSSIIITSSQIHLLSLITKLFRVSSTVLVTKLEPKLGLWLEFFFMCRLMVFILGRHYRPQGPSHHAKPCAEWQGVCQNVGLHRTEGISPVRLCSQILGSLVLPLQAQQHPLWSCSETANRKTFSSLIHCFWIGCQASWFIKWVACWILKK